ncbi:MAG: GAF domain-containing protein [Anaerolineales bacterium]|nr:GAF domain-containing protein [Anaerolineales bacterium]
MQDAGPSSLLDWIVITVRWGFLISASLWLATGVGFTWPIILVFAVAVLGNIVASVMILMKHNNSIFRMLCVAGDFLFAHLLTVLSGPTWGENTWVALLPLVSAALYFRWLGAALLILLNFALQAWFALAVLEPLDIFLLSIILPVYLIVGLPLAFAGQRLAAGGFWGLIGRSPAESKADRVEREHRKTIFEMLSLLSESLNYQRVLETSLDLSASALAQLGASVEKLVGAVLLFAEEGNKAPELRVAASRRLLSADTRTTLPGTRGVLGRAIDEGEPHLTRTANKDPELSRFVILHDCRSAYCIPLRRGLDAYGILLFAHPDPDFFTPELREVLDIVGNQSVIAIQNARLYQDLEQEKERMMEIQEEARKKMARDLHDGPTQSVSAIAMRVNFARRLMERDLKAASEEMYKIEDLARRTTKEIRHMLFTLRPLVLESQGLVAALESMAEKMKETYDQNVAIQADPRVAEELEAGKQAVVFYIAEEAVNNARKHAQAAHIWVRLKMLKDNISLLEIEDDGVGFDVGAVGSSYESRGSLGMVNMRERTELVNGVLRIDSAKGRGARIQVVIPLTEDAADMIRRGL